MEERTTVPLIKEGGMHTCIPMHVVCLLMGFRPKNEPNDPYDYPNDPGILLIPKHSCSIRISSKSLSLSLEPIQDHFVPSSNLLNV